MTWQCPNVHPLQKGHASVVKLLLENGASKDAANRNGRTPLAVAAEVQGRESVVSVVKYCRERERKGKDKKRKEKTQGAV